MGARRSLTLRLASMLAGMLSWRGGRGWSLLLLLTAVAHGVGQGRAFVPSPLGLGSGPSYGAVTGVGKALAWGVGGGSLAGRSPGMGQRVRRSALVDPAGAESKKGGSRKPLAAAVLSWIASRIIQKNTRMIVGLDIDVGARSNRDVIAGNLPSVKVSVVLSPLLWRGLTVVSHIHLSPVSAGTLRPADAGLAADHGGWEHGDHGA
jgi:hypothetical protein